MACAWMDRKTVVAMSTNTQPSAMGSVLRRQKDRSRQPVPCPEAIITYNQHMGGVDRGDQLRGYYSCRARSRKFYRYIFFFLFDVAITNSYILYKHYCPTATHKNIKDFRTHLAKQLIGDYCSRLRSGRTPAPLRPLPLRHFPTRVPSETPQHKRGRCAQCRETRHRRTDTTWYCRECEVWLCHTGDPATDCFLRWHTHHL